MPSTSNGCVNLDPISLETLQKTFNSILKDKPKLLILGIGENRMGDDGIGPWLTYNLYRQFNHDRVLIMNVGVLPEHRLDEMKAFNPDIIILIDAIQKKETPGTFAIFTREQMCNYLPISSHSMPIPIFVDRVEMEIPKVKLYLVGIEPFHLEFEEAFHLYDEEDHELDDFEEDPNIPFYRFYLSPKMQEIAKDLLKVFSQLLSEHYQ